MIVLTVGRSYVDIDGYASSLAYRELLKILGIESKFVTHATLNYSITNSLLQMPYKIDEYKINTDDKFIILDLSNKEFFPDFVNENNVIELIDHHSGFEEYWNDKTNTKSIIEPIGSVATIIVEKYEQNNLLNKMDKDIAKLLMAAILDNTLNFTAEITNERDKSAYRKLQVLSGEYNFADTYFSECQNAVENNLKDSIVNDLKHQKTNEYLPDTIGQLTIWDIDRLNNKLNTIKEIMNYDSKNWIINIISLKDNTSYIMYSDSDVLQNATKLFNCDYNDNYLMVKPAKLRKEIMKAALLKKEENSLKKYC